MKKTISILMMFLTLHAFAVDKYISPTGSNAANGDTGTPWQTIAYAESQASAGYNIYIRAGTYNEQPTINLTGTSNSWVNFVGEEGTIVRGANFSSASYVRWINIKTTHTNTSLGSRPFQLSGTCSHIEFWDCVMTNVFSGETEAVIYLGGTPSYTVIRGCTIGNVNPQSLGGDHRNYGISGALITPNHTLVDGCTMFNITDFYSLYGSSNIVDRVSIIGHDDSFWTNGTGHSDFLQVGSDGLDVGTKMNVYQRIFGGDNQCMGMAENTKNGHFLLLQDQQPGGVGPYGDNTNFIFRGNIGFHINDGVVGIIGADRFIGYNNSFHDLNTTGVGYTPVLFWRFAVVDSIFKNNLFNGTSATLPIEILDSSVVSASNNGGNPTHSSFSFTGDPLYSSPAAPGRKFYLQSGSSARGAAAALVTITSVSGSGVSFAVDNPFALNDGYGITDGDRVVIGATTTYITGINWATSTVTVRDSVSWTQNTTKVHWDNDSMDGGALPFGAVEMTAATLITTGTTNEVQVTGDSGGVWFYTNGIPAQWVKESPYIYVNTNSSTITARAYARYAQAVPVITAGDGQAPATPTVEGVDISGSVEFSGDIEFK